MRIGTNISAIISNNALQKGQSALSTSIERLSSGYKLNSSKDDPAGMAISEKMRSQIRGLDQSENNATDGVSVLNTAEGALAEIQSMLSRMKELTVQAANDVNSDEERQAIQDELNNINKEIDRISDQTEFNTQSLISGNLSRRVYSDFPGVKQVEVSDGFVAGDYGITVKEDARQAVAVGQGTVTMTATQTITKEQEGTISFNGYEVSITEGDNLNTIMTKLVDGMNMTGGRAFAITAGAESNTADNGTASAGYLPQTSYTGNNLVFMTNQFGSDQKLTISCSNTELAGMLGIDASATEEGWTVDGSDVKAEFTTVDGKRVGFEDSAIMSTKGTKITVNDVNNKTFVTDVPGNIAGTVYDDSFASKQLGKSVVSASNSVDNIANITQEVTDVGTMSIHIGANENQVIKLDIPEVTTYTLGTEHINVMTSYTSQQAVATVDTAINKANEVRSKIGAYSNRFEHTINNLQSSSENMTSALSTMTDTDMAEEMTTYTSQTVLTQAATSILSQANQRPAEVLQILQ
ncbi:MAG: flagellin [Lachnospira sp.]|nr:flagellin [Lachnospira sp.]